MQNLSREQAEQILQGIFFKYVERQTITAQDVANGLNASSALDQIREYENMLKQNQEAGQKQNGKAEKVKEN